MTRTCGSYPRDQGSCAKLESLRHFLPRVPPPHSRYHRSCLLSTSLHLSELPLRFSFTLRCWWLVASQHSYSHESVRHVEINLWPIKEYLSLRHFLCWLFYNPVDCSLPGSSDHGISQARILEWVAIFFSRGSSRPREQTHVSYLAGEFFTTEPPGKPLRPFLLFSC